MKKILLFIGLVLELASCTKTLDMDYDEISPLMVVQGNVSNSGMYVYLTLTDNMEDSLSAKPVTDATVIVKGSDGFEEALVYGDGRYYSSNNSVGVPGVTYTLHIRRGDKECFAESTMPQIVSIDSVKLEWMPVMNDIDIRVMKVFLTDNPDTEDYYRLEILRDGELVKHTISGDWGLVNGFNYIMQAISSRNTMEDDEDEKKKTGKEESDVLYTGDHIVVSLRTIDYNAYHFFSSGEDNSDGANPESNLKGEGFLGYFSAYAVDEKTMVYPGLDD